MHELGQQILKDVSRSFYLSLRLLPKAMREPISLGYLLARASDTIADTEGLDASLRSEMLGGFDEVLLGGDRVQWLARLSTDVTRHQKHKGEKALLRRMEDVFSWLDDLDFPLQELIHKVMRPIIKGQCLDIERFELQDGYQIESDEQLEEYCYLVAGCVGEFWTEVGLLTLSDFSRISSDELRKRGIQYGKGLQLINILRDLPADLKQGRCYIPSVDSNDTKQLMVESARWQQKARCYLADGQYYAKSLKGRRTRIATALPGFIGAKTLDLLAQADWQTLQAGVKIPRRQVYACFLQAMMN
ncbi:MAG: phytoene/squalene synthase family protein [Akkermansiaceae bacterium]